MRLIDRVDCVCGRGKDNVMLSWHASWGFLTSLFQDDQTMPTSNERVMKRNRSSFQLATESNNAAPSKRNNTMHGWTQETHEVHVAPSIPMPRLERTGTLTMIAPNSAQIREELQRFARSQQDAADTRYHLKVLEKMTQFNNCLTDSCVS